MLDPSRSARQVVNDVWVDEVPAEQRWLITDEMKVLIARAVSRYRSSKNPKEPSSIESEV